MVNAGSNTKGRIAELRRNIAANKGKAQRAEDTAFALRNKASRAWYQIEADRREIEALGGKVRR